MQATVSHRVDSKAHTSAPYARSRGHILAVADPTVVAQLGSRFVVPASCSGCAIHLAWSPTDYSVRSAKAPGYQPKSSLSIRSASLLGHLAKKAVQPIRNPSEQLLPAFARRSQLVALAGIVWSGRSSIMAVMAVFTFASVTVILGES